MANITRYNPFEDLLADIGKGSERSYGMVSRSFSLPTDVDEKGAKAEYKDGVLNLVLPKKANGCARRIEVV